MNKLFYVSLGLALLWLFAGSNVFVGATVVIGQVVVAFLLSKGKTI